MLTRFVGPYTKLGRFLANYILGRNIFFIGCLNFEVIFLHPPMGVNTPQLFDLFLLELYFLFPGRLCLWLFENYIFCPPTDCFFFFDLSLLYFHLGATVTALDPNFFEFSSMLYVFTFILLSLVTTTYPSIRKNSSYDWTLVSIFFTMRHQSINWCVLNHVTKYNVLPGYRLEEKSYITQAYRLVGWFYV